jgi:hypothetical protein
MPVVILAAGGIQRGGVEHVIVGRTGQCPVQFLKGIREDFGKKCIFPIRVLLKG